MTQLQRTSSLLLTPQKRVIQYGHKEKLGTWWNSDLTVEIWGLTHSEICRPAVKTSDWKQTAAVVLLSAGTVSVWVGVAGYGCRYPRCPDIKSFCCTHTVSLCAACVLIYIDPWVCGGSVIKLTHQQRNWWLHQTTSSEKKTKKVLT